MKTQTQLDYPMLSLADMENVKIITQAMFLKYKCYLKARKLRQMRNATKPCKLCVQDGNFTLGSITQRKIYLIYLQTLQ